MTFKEGQIVETSVGLAEVIASDNQTALVKMTESTDYAGKILEYNVSDLKESVSKEGLYNKYKTIVNKFKSKKEFDDAKKYAFKRFSSPTEDTLMRVLQWNKQLDISMFDALEKIDSAGIKSFLDDFDSAVSKESVSKEGKYVVTGRKRGDSGLVSSKMLVTAKDKKEAKKLAIKKGILDAYGIVVKLKEAVSKKKLSFFDIRQKWDGDASSGSPYAIARKNGDSHEDAVRKAVASESVSKESLWTVKIDGKVKANIEASSKIAAEKDWNILRKNVKDGDKGYTIDLAKESVSKEGVASYDGLTISAYNQRYNNINGKKTAVGSVKVQGENANFAKVDISTVKLTDAVAYINKVEKFAIAEIKKLDKLPDKLSKESASKEAVSSSKYRLPPMNSNSDAIKAFKKFGASDVKQISGKHGSEIQFSLADSNIAKLNAWLKSNDFDEKALDFKEAVSKEVLLKSYKKKGYDDVSLNSGSDGNGKTIFVVQTQRKSKSGKNIYSNEQFKTRAEAEKWIKHAVSAPKEGMKEDWLTDQLDEISQQMFKQNYNDLSDSNRNKVDSKLGPIGN